MLYYINILSNNNKNMYAIYLHIFIFNYEKILLRGVSMNKNIYDTVRRNIKKYRKMKKLNQQELADLADLSHGYIREIESPNMGTTFSLDAVEKIANGLGIEIKLLFDENE